MIGTEAGEWKKMGPTIVLVTSTMLHGVSPAAFSPFGLNSDSSSSLLKEVQGLGFRSTKGREEAWV